MRVCFDSITVADLPPNGDLYMGYKDGQWPNYDAVVQRFPGKTVIGVTTNPADNEGDMLDVEQGDATPQDAPGWTVRRRQAGHIGPLVYFPETLRAQILQAFAASVVPLPGLFAAAYPGEGPVLQQPGDVGHQWSNADGTYDESVVIDYLPGIDPPPTWEDDSVLLLDRHVHDDGTVETKILAVGAGGNTPQGHLLLIDMKENDPSSASVTDITAGIAGKNNGWTPLVAP